MCETKNTMGEASRKSHLKNLIDEYKQWLAKYESMRLQHIVREQNKATLLQMF